MERANACKYKMLLLLHLEKCVIEFGPPIYYQYWMDLCIRWALSRMNARNPARPSLLNDTKFQEAYNSFFENEPVQECEALDSIGYAVKGQSPR